ncbi:MAG: V-type ATPase 116kDa subunit family protein [Candidatus Hodarchaeales archaeon]
MFLGNIGVAQYIDVHDELELFDGLLEQYEVPDELVIRPSNILARVDHTLEGLELKPEEIVDREPLPPEKTMEEILTEVEQKLSEIEGRSKPFIETFISSANIVRKIDHMLSAWKINPKKLLVENKSFPKELTKEMFLEAEQKLSDIERRFKEIVEISARCSTILSEIEHLSKRLKVKIKEGTIGKTPFPPDEINLEFVERTLLEIDESSKTINENRDLHIRQLMIIKTTITKIMKQIPEIKTDLAKQTVELRNLADLVRQSTKVKPEFKTIHFDLLKLRTIAKELEEVIKVGNNMGSCATTVYLEAWVPKRYLEKVTNEIKKITKGKCIIEAKPPKSEDQVPTIIKPLPRFFEAFEKLTYSLGYPRPEEVNPVLLMAITFPFLFGIMFADVGQGAILLTVGFILLYFRGKVDIDKVGDIMRYFIVSGGLFVLCGISAIIFGFLFGEFFGPSGVLHPITVATIGPFQIGGFDPMHEPLSMLRFAIFIGVIMLSLGLVLRVVNNIKKRIPKSALISSCWIWLLLGGFIMWIYWGGISNITRWFAEGTLMFLGLIVSPVVLIGIVTATSGSIMEGIDFSIEVLIESLDHTISFSRLAALFLTHTALNQMFLIIAGVENGVFTLQSIPIIMIGSLLALSIEGLIVFVHCLRLHWVELFPEFYSGKGIPFKPLKVK